MGLRLTSAEGKTAMYDSAGGVAFGPVFDDIDEAESFLAWVDEHSGGIDPRDMTNRELFNHFDRWCDQGDEGFGNEERRSGAFA